MLCNEATYFPLGMILDGKDQCGGFLCSSHEHRFRRCTCSCKTPKLLLLRSAQQLDYISSNLLLGHLTGEHGQLSTYDDGSFGRSRSSKATSSITVNVGFKTDMHRSHGNAQRQTDKTVTRRQMSVPNQWREWSSRSPSLPNLHHHLSPAKPWH